MKHLGTTRKNVMEFHRRYLHLRDVICAQEGFPSREDYIVGVSGDHIPLGRESNRLFLKLDKWAVSRGILD